MINGLDSPVLLQLHLLLLLHLHVLLGQVVIALVYLVYLAQIVVIGQRTERIVVDAAHATAMMAMSVVAVMWRKVREIICNDKSRTQQSGLIKVNVAAVSCQCGCCRTP